MGALILWNRIMPRMTRDVLYIQCHYGSLVITNSFSFYQPIKIMDESENPNFAENELLMDYEDIIERGTTTDIILFYLFWGLLIGYFCAVFIPMIYGKIARCSMAAHSVLDGCTLSARSPQNVLRIPIMDSTMERMPRFLCFAVVRFIDQHPFGVLHAL